MASITLRLARAAPARRERRDWHLLLIRVITRCRQMLCALRGHSWVLHFGHRRMSLLCVACGRETSGWEVGPTRVYPRQLNTRSKAA